MSMNGIDISSWQSGIDLSRVPCEFVVCKATEGTGYVSPVCDTQYQQAKRLGKGLGVYHYANGKNYQVEADYFLNNIRGYIGEALLALDWEQQGNARWGNNDREWVRAWCDYVYEKTKVRPIVYVQASARGRLTGIGDYGLWIAQYASNAPTGYQETPWNEGAYECAMRQYSSTGRLAGYAGDLDLNKFYGDRAAWEKYAAGDRAGGGAPKPEPKPPKDLVQVDGWWGPETTRKAQRVFGTVQDGIVSNQPEVNRRYLPNAYTGSWQFKASGYGAGSDIIRAVQRRIGTGVDGWFGVQSVRALQRYVRVSVDGSMGPATVRAFQRWLNER